MRSSRKVVVTGLGIVSPLGLDVKHTWSKLLEGQSGVTRFKSFDHSDQIAGLVSNFQLTNFKTRHLKRLDAFIQYGLAASQEAIKDAQLDCDDSFDKQRVGVSIGSGLGGFSFLEKQHNNLLESARLGDSAFRKISPFFIPGTIINMVSGLCSMEYGFQGPNFSVVSACATGAHSIGIGARSIASGDADVMIVGGAEMGSALLSIAGFAACGALSNYNGQAEKASRPWDQARDGFVLADGAAVLVLEEYQHALKRGVAIYGEISGVGMSADAYNMTAPEPSGSGARLAMERALADAAIKPFEVDYINAHATSTILGDIAEMKAIERIWGDQVKEVKISATKSMTGHLLGAAGSLEAAFCLLAMRDEMIPPTLNLENPDPCLASLDLVPHHAQQSQCNITLSNSFGFGGTNVSLVFAKL